MSGAVPESNDADVVVVGAGLSGLRAALELHRSGVSVIVLESHKHVGGRLRFFDVDLHGSTAKHDVSAAWLNNTTHSEMFSLAKTFGFDLINQYVSGRFLHQKKYGSVVSYPLGFGADILHPDVRGFYAMLQRLAEAWQGPDRKALDSVTLKALAEANGDDKQVAGEEADVLAGRLFGTSAVHVSALFVIDMIKSTGGLQSMLSWYGAHYRIRQGVGAFASCLSSMLPGGSVQLGKEVVSIVQSGPLCYVTTADNVTLRCKKVIVSVPHTQYGSIVFHPPLPRAMDALATDTTDGYYATVVLEFATPWWREAGLSGSFDSAPGQGPVSVACDTCSEQDNHYSLTCFVVGETGRRWSTNGEDQRRSEVWGHVRSVFSARVDEASIPDPIGCVIKEWPQRTMAVMPPGVLDSEAGEALGKPFGNIHFVGAETSDVWKGYMEGAVRSGIRGANEVVVALGDSLRSHL
ncbi:flavin-containing amine [Echria macrotheca]|uniref:Amine oxidase n=1 Tax=Echria macrotheca TaxID=438768 RepID=A0AAJ0FAA4_9PEZI|nr:flavin-containing amine [Echria macrotheca]